MSHGAKRRFRPLGGVLVGAALAFAFGSDALGCSRDHSFLASTSSTSSSGGGMMTTAASSSSVGSGGAGTGGANQGGEPPGPPRLTVLDAIVDADAVRLCFVAYPNGDPNAEPWPGASGLAYGDAELIPSSSGVIPKATDVLAIVIGGDLSQTNGKTCDAIVAEAGMTGSGGAGGSGGASIGGSGGAGAGAPFSAVSLGVLPAAVFTAERSLLLAPTGCLGGAGHDDPNAALICGTGYSSTNPTAQLAALPLSREVEPGRIALQLVQASVATPALMVDVSATSNSSAFPIAMSLPFGGAQPTPPFVGFHADQLANSGQIFAYPVTGGVPLSTTSLGDAFAHGDSGTLLDDHAYALVAIGASPTLEAGSWWHKFIWTAVRSDP